LHANKTKIFVFLAGITFGGLIAAWVFGKEILAKPSALDSFARVALGSSTEELEMTLRARGIACQWAALSTSLHACTFSDFSHEYRILVNADTNHIIRKSFSFRRPRLL